MDRSKTSRLAQSAYLSPYSRSGALTPNRPHPNAAPDASDSGTSDSRASSDPYAALRARALSTLEAMGYDPRTMVEHGVLWAEHQDPFGHVMQSQYMAYLGTCFHRVMESYHDYLSDDEYEGMISGRTVIPAIRRYQLDIRRQVTYPDALIAAYRQERIDPTHNNGVTSLFSLKQQAIVAEVRGSVTYMSLQTGRPVDVRTLGGNWPALYDGFTRWSAESQARREEWDSQHGKASKVKAKV